MNEDDPSTSLLFGIGLVLVLACIGLAALVHFVLRG